LHRCRSCSSKAAFSSFVKGVTNPAAATPTTTAPTTSIPDDCPPDVEALGRSSWTLLHSIAATYPEQPTRSQQNDLLGFVHLFAKLYPCWTCAEDFQGYVAKSQPQVESRGKFGMWLCGAHNDVNRKLGKKEFDCSRWEERWRTGWKDGRCD
jgi:FAD-linked sulfhydryl oxidase